MFEKKHQKSPPITTSFARVSLDQIDDPERPIRTDLSPESVEDLVYSIRKVGLLEPLVVKPVGERYEVIAGHRRLIAAQIAPLAEVPCYIVQADPEQTEIYKLHENLYRASINPIDEAEHYQYLIEHYKQSSAKLAHLVGKSQSYIVDRLAILNYPEVLREALAQKFINFSVAREFYRIHDTAKLTEYLRYAVRDGLTPALAKKWVDDYTRTQAIPAPNPEAAPDLSQPNPEITTHSRCVYCKEDIDLAEANTVYIHSHCLTDVNSQ